MAYVPLFNDYGDRVLAIANRTKDQYPQDWANAHNGQPSGETFIRRVAYTVSVEIPEMQCGLNLKRGNQGLSQDVLAFPNATGARDATGTFAGLELRDIIASAGTPHASLVWGDVTQATIDKGDPGGWVKPEPVDGAPIPPQPPAIPSYEELGGDEGAKQISRVLDHDYRAAGRPGLDADCGSWLRRTDYDFLSGICTTVEESIAKHRDEWLAALGLITIETGLQTHSATCRICGQSVGYEKTKPRPIPHAADCMTR